MAIWLALLTLGWMTPVPASKAVVGLQDSLPTLEWILDRYLTAVGGREAIERLTTRTLTGRLVTDLPSRQPPVYETIDFRVLAKTPGRYLFVQVSSPEPRRQGYDGTTCWQLVGDTLDREAQYDRRFAWLVDPHNALRVREYFTDMRVVGESELDGRASYRVAIDDDESHDLFFDAESGLLVRLGYNRELRDYRAVDGIRYPYRIVVSRKGGSSSYLFDEVVHNLPIDDSEFAPPGD